VSPVCVRCIIITLPHKLLDGGGILNLALLLPYSCLTLALLLTHCCHYLDTCMTGALRGRAACGNVVRCAVVHAQLVCDVTSLMQLAY